jgi:hypothetical protein
MPTQLDNSFADPDELLAAELTDEAKRDPDWRKKMWDANNLLDRPTSVCPPSASPPSDPSEPSE